MHTSIYYVGSHQFSNHSSNKFRQKQLATIRIPSTRRQKHNTLSNSNQKSYRDRKNLSRSTSCPKTQRSSFMKNINRLRGGSPTNKVEQWAKKVFRGGQKENNEIQQQFQKQKSQLSSAFQIVPMKNNNRIKLTFKKVQQPQNVIKRVQWNITNEQVHPEQQKSQQRNTKNNSSSHQRKDMKRMQNTNMSNPQQNLQDFQQQVMQNNSHYRIQPFNRFFLCTRCYQFCPRNDLVTHQRQCQIPLKKQQFTKKWHTLISLLKILEQEHQNSSLFRLIDRMGQYIESYSTKNKESYIMYSESLSAIIALKSSTSLQQLKRYDLFLLIETLGDLLETQSLQFQDEQHFWKICT